MKRIQAFPKGINPKVNVIAWQEFELAYFKHFNHYPKGTPPSKKNFFNQ